MSVASVYQTQAPLTRQPKRTGRRIAPETPHEIIESEAYEAGAELIYYRDIDQVQRINADAGCDDAVRRMEQAFRNDDAPAFWAAADDYWTNDRDEDGAGESGDGRVRVAHTHLRTIPAMVVEIEMGACPATAIERGILPSRQRAGKGQVTQ